MTTEAPRTGHVLVTGALGNVGCEVARACLAGGFEVCVAGTRVAALRETFTSSEAVRLDLLDRSTWAAALARARHVFLLRPPAIADVKATLNPFLDTAWSAGVEHVVFLSVAGAERSSWVPHRGVEEHLERSGRGWTILRPGFFAQNFGDAYVRDVVEDRRIYVPAGRGRVAFIDVFDVGDAVARIFARPEAHAGTTPTLTGPEAVTFDEAAAMMTEVLGRPIRYVPATIPGYAWHLATRRRLPAIQIAVQTFLHVGLRRGDAEPVDAALEALLGRPATTLRSYFERERARWAPQDRAPGSSFAS